MNGPQASDADLRFESQAARLNGVSVQSLEKNICGGDILRLPGSASSTKRAKGGSVVGGRMGQVGGEPQS